MARTILIADDDPYIREMLRETLTAAGYSVVLADSGSAAVDAYVADKPDLILLDLMMPDLSGDRALPYFDGTPVIVISAKTDVTDKVELLHGGAVDYVTKPFDVRELIARIELRLAERFCGDDAEYNGLKLDSERVAHCGERSVRLTRTEYAILKLFLQNPNKVFSKSQILDKISSNTPDCTDGSLKVHVGNLRSKLRELCGREFLVSVWGIGFKLGDR